MQWVPPPGGCSGCPGGGGGETAGRQEAPGDFKACMRVGSLRPMHAGQAGRRLPAGSRASPPLLWWPHPCGACAGCCSQCRAEHRAAQASTMGCVGEAGMLRAAQASTKGCGSQASRLGWCAGRVCGAAQCSTSRRRVACRVAGHPWRQQGGARLHSLVYVGLEPVAQLGLVPGPRLRHQLLAAQPTHELLLLSQQLLLLGDRLVQRCGRQPPEGWWG